MALEILAIENTWSVLGGWWAYDQAESVAIAADGTIWIAGHYISPDGDSDAYLDRKSSKNGETLDIFIYGTFNDDWANDLVIDSAGGSIYLTGTHGIQETGKQFAFLVKYDNKGDLIWEKTISSGTGDLSQTIVSAPNGAVYIAGSTYGNLDGITNRGAQDAFISKYEPDGSRTWTALLGSSLADWAHSITISPDGSLYITGVTYGNLQKENGESHIQQGIGDSFLAKYDINGNNLWTRVLGSANYDKGNCVIASNDGSIFVVGDTGGNLAGIPGKGGNDIFLSKFASDGQILWTTLLGTIFEESALSATFSEDGFIYITGITYGNLDGITNSGSGDAFLAKYSTDGVKQWTKLIGSSGTDWARSITSGTNGELYISGMSNGDLFEYSNSGSYDSFITKFEYPELAQVEVNTLTIDLPKTTSGTALGIPDTRNPVVVVTSSGSPDFISISAPVNAALNAFTTELHGIGTIARNVGTLTSPGTGQIVSLKGVGKYSFVATAIPEATTTINLEANKNTAFFLHDAYSAFYEGLTLTPDSSGRRSTQRVLNVDTIKMGSAGGTSIVDLTSKDYVTGAVTVYGANQGRSIFWGTSSNDAFISGGGDSVIFGGGGANQLTLGTGKDTIQYRSGANAIDKISGFVVGQDKVELWIGKDQVTIEPNFALVNGSTIMTWGGNQVEFVGVADLNLSNLLPITRTA